MKYKLMSIVFCGLLLCGMGLNLATPDRDISYTERRQLAQAPKIDGEFLATRGGGEQIEKYLLDQFWNRDSFRILKVWFDRKVLRKSDTNGLYEAEGHLVQMEYPIDEDSVRSAAQKMLAIQEKFLPQDAKVAYAVIPDKAHYISEGAKRPSLDYGEMTAILSEELPEMDYLSLEEHLSLEDYYRTDLHWKQENLTQVTEVIWKQFDIHAQLNIQDMSAHAYKPFYGAYYGRTASSIKPDELIWLTDGKIDGLRVKDYDEVKESKDVVYAEEKLGGVDSYELFFGGNSPLITIDNPQCQGNRQLIVFRDSFGSSIAPLLAKEYSRVVLVDLRFMGYEFLDQFVSFDDADVLFLWGQQVYNNSTMLRQR